jgi:hypothetical protein
MSVIEDEPAVVEDTVADRTVVCRLSEEALAFASEYDGGRVNRNVPEPKA